MRTILISAIALGLILTSGCKSYVKHSSYGGNFPDKKMVNTLSDVTLAPNSREEIPTFDSTANAPISTFKKNDIRIRKALTAFHKVKPFGKPKPEPKPEKLPVEKNAQAGFWTAIAAYILPTLVQVSFLLLGLEMPLAVSIILAILTFGGLITAFVLGLIGKRNINKEPDKYRGYGKAIAAIVIPAVVLALTILYLIFFILLFALLLAIL